MNLTEKIKEVLKPPHNLFSIIKHFEEWSQSNRKALLAEADSWLLQLYSIDADFFSSFLIAYVPEDNPQLITAVYERPFLDYHGLLIEKRSASGGRLFEYRVKKKPAGDADGLSAGGHRAT